MCQVPLVAQQWRIHLQCRTPPCNAMDTDLIPGSGRSSGEGNGDPLQHSCLENSMDRAAWWATVLGISRVGYDLVTPPPPPPSVCLFMGPIEKKNRHLIWESQEPEAWDGFLFWWVFISSCFPSLTRAPHHFSLAWFLTSSAHPWKQDTWCPTEPFTRLHDFLVQCGQPGLGDSEHLGSPLGQWQER